MGTVDELSFSNFLHAKARTYSGESRRQQPQRFQTMDDKYAEQGLPCLHLAKLRQDDVGTSLWVEIKHFENL